ncbi:hypothetical protein P3597_26820, partial [Vibrio parahaemolyticus]|nr:hypothetical protein [Vibrio parahaemolyticus]
GIYPRNTRRGFGSAFRSLPLSGPLPKCSLTDEVITMKKIILSMALMSSSSLASQTMGEIIGREEDPNRPIEEVYGKERIDKIRNGDDFCMYEYKTDKSGKIKSIKLEGRPEDCKSLLNYFMIKNKDKLK